MDDMMKALSQFKNGTYLKLSWLDRGCCIGGTIDTIYESCNDMDETGFYEQLISFPESLIDQDSLVRSSSLESIFVASHITIAPWEFLANVFMIFAL